MARSRKNSQRTAGAGQTAGAELLGPRVTALERELAELRQQLAVAKLDETKQCCLGEGGDNSWVYIITQRFARSV